MTNDLAWAAPADWYPDPAGASSQRWWDGARWTEHVAAPSAVRPYGEHLTQRVAEGTPVYTVWIWLVITAPLLPLLLLFGFDMSGYMLRSVIDPTAVILMYLDPWYLGTVVTSWAVYGLAVWFAYMDSAELARRGFGRRFHWAWSFLSTLIYVIGRSVVVRRQASRGTAPLHVGIWLNVAMFVAIMIWTIVATVQIMTGVMEIATTYGTSL